MWTEGGRTVLLQGAATQSLRPALEAAGYIVRSAASVEECLEQVPNDAVSITLVDGDISDDACREVVQRLARETCVVVVGSQPTTERVVRLMRAGAAYYLHCDREGRYLEQILPVVNELFTHAGRGSIDAGLRFRQIAHALVHDVRNPLGNILGYVELMGESGALAPEQLNFLERIRSNCSQALQLMEAFAATVDRTLEKVEG